MNIVGRPILAAAGFQPALVGCEDSRRAVCEDSRWPRAKTGAGRVRRLAQAWQRRLALGWQRRLAHGPNEPPERRLQARLPAPLIT